ncbi:MAG: hypothetical protein DRJ35_08245 [Thermoprotei archaeon]|nr:MAG: hypothetical protein DRJ35_08245 [Thermoprotei archaeon]
MLRWVTILFLCLISVAEAKVSWFPLIPPQRVTLWCLNERSEDVLLLITGDVCEDAAFSLSPLRSGLEEGPRAIVEDMKEEMCPARSLCRFEIEDFVSFSVFHPPQTTVGVSLGNGLLLLPQEATQYDVPCLLNSSDVTAIPYVVFKGCERCQFLEPPANCYLYFVSLQFYYEFGEPLWILDASGEGCEGHPLGTHVSVDVDICYPSVDGWELDGDIEEIDFQKLEFILDVLAPYVRSVRMDERICEKLSKEYDFLSCDPPYRYNHDKHMHVSFRRE